jgi:hypothetical protein
MEIFLYRIWLLLWRCYFRGNYCCITVGLINGFESVANGNFDDAGWSILYVIFGGLTCYGIYKLLENKLEKERELNRKEGIENIGIIEEN